MIKNKSSYALILISLCISVKSQTNERSPYSAFGLGDNFNSSFISYQAMGSTGTALQLENNFTFQNPASYSSLKFTSLQMGAIADIGHYQNSNQSAKFSAAQFSYFALGLPVWEKNNGAIAFGASPASTIGYQMKVPDTADIISTTKYLGDGGLSKLVLGGSFEPIKNLAIGVNFNYLFGNISKTRELSFPFQTNIFGFTRSENINYSGWQTNLGVQYSIRQKNVQHCFGFTYNPKGTLSGKGQILTRNNKYSYQIGDAQTLDTISLKNLSSLEEKIPESLSIGYAIGDGEKWSFSADYSISFWEKISNEYKNEQGISAGFFLVPKLRPGLGTNYLQRVKYSFGVFKKQSFIFLNQKQIESYGINIGLGLPMVKRIKRYAKEDLTIISRLHFSFSYNERGTTENNLIRENFFQFGLGANLGDKWFIKRKYQ
ncbi:MAG: hypothetical protein CNE98_04300 [Bacteroidetes bacterium MED-G17]|nr:MAG: hypothetical protein CNE98_04300 [Bacteroidetes bacterium MED-G17]